MRRKLGARTFADYQGTASTCRRPRAGRYRRDDLARACRRARRRRHLGGADRQVSSRASLVVVGLRRLAPSESPDRLPPGTGAGVNRLAAVLPVHTYHADQRAGFGGGGAAHGLRGRSAASLRRKCRLAGRASARTTSVGRHTGRGNCRSARSASLIRVGHSLPARPLARSPNPSPPAKASAYRYGEAWSTLIHAKRSQTAHQGSAASSRRARRQTPKSSTRSASWPAARGTPPEYWADGANGSAERPDPSGRLFRPLSEPAGTALRRGRPT